MVVVTYPANVKEFAYNLYKAGFSTKKIQEEIKNKFNLEVKENTIKQWIYRFKRKEKAEKSLHNVLKKIEEETGEYFYSDDYAVKKEIVKQSSKKSQTKPQTAVDRIINKEITEVATDIVADYILVGKELKEKLEEHAKAYGFGNIKEFVLFLFDFWDKHKYDIERLKKLEEENEELKLKIKLLKILLSPRVKEIIEKIFFEKMLKENINFAMLMKLSSNEFNSDKFIDEIFKAYINNKYNNLTWLQ